MSVIVQQDATIYSFIIFLQTALHVSDDVFIHHQERTQNVITTSGTGRTVFAAVRWLGGVGTTPPRQRTAANTVRPVPDVITFWVSSWWWMRVSSETCRAVCRNIIKTVYSPILLDNYWHWFTMHGPMIIIFCNTFLYSLSIFLVLIPRRTSCNRRFGERSVSACNIKRFENRADRHPISTH